MSHLSNLQTTYKINPITNPESTSEEDIRPSQDRPSRSRTRRPAPEVRHANVYWLNMLIFMVLSNIMDSVQFYCRIKVKQVLITSLHLKPKIWVRRHRNRRSGPTDPSQGENQVLVNSRWFEIFYISACFWLILWLLSFWTLGSPPLSLLKAFTALKSSEMDYFVSKMPYYMVFSNLIDTAHFCFRIQQRASSNSQPKAIYSKPNWRRKKSVLLRTRTQRNSLTVIAELGREIGLSRSPLSRRTQPKPNERRRPLR